MEEERPGWGIVKRMRLSSCPDHTGSLTPSAHTHVCKHTHTPTHTYTPLLPFVFPTVAGPQVTDLYVLFTKK